MSTLTVTGTNFTHWRGGGIVTGNAVIGYESSRFCTGRYTFTTGSKQVTGLTINWQRGTESYYVDPDGYGSSRTFYCYIGTNANDSSHINPTSSPATDATLTFSSSSPYLPSATITKTLLPNTIYYLWVFTTYAGYGWRYWPRNNVSITLTQIDYTGCGAPTSITTPNIVKPSDTITISWSGATSGVSNAINGYNIYWTISSDGTRPTTSSYTSTTSIATTNSSGSKSISISDVERGLKVVFGIITKGAAGSSYYSEMAYSTATAINKLPSTPTPSVTQVVIPSTSTGQTITVTPGTDEDSGQTCKVYYATSSTGPKSEYTQALEVNTTSTYYFWTYDGLEYSENYSTCAITKNIKPVISSFAAVTNSINTITALNGVGTGTKCLGYANYYTPTITCSKSGTLRWYIEMQSGGNGTGSFSSEATYNLSNQNITSTSATTLPIVNADLAVEANYDISTENSFYRWRVACILNDGIEDSDIKYFPSDSTKYYAVPGMSTVQSKFNQFSSTGNITGTTAGKMYDKVRFILFNDTSISTVEVIAISNNATLQTNVVTSTSSNSRYIDVTLGSIPSSGATINFTINYKNSNITKTTSTSMIECTHISIGNYNLNFSSLKPFTQKSDSNIGNISYPFGSYTTLSSALAAYECDTTPSSAIKFSLNRSGNEQITAYRTISKSGDFLNLTLDNANVFAWDSSLGITNYSGTYNCDARVCIENLYGAKFYSTPTALTLNFNESPVSEKIDSVKYGSNTNLGSKYIQEGMTVKFHTSCSAYTNGNITFELYKNNTKVSSKNVAVNNSTSNYVVASCDLSSYIDEITTASSITWKTVAKNSTGSTNSSVLTNVLRHTAPSWSFDNCEVTESNNTYSLNLAYTVTDLGIGASGNTAVPTNFSQAYYVVDAEDSAITSSFALPTNQSSYSITCNSGWEAKSLRIKMASSVVAGGNVATTSTKIFYTNVIPVFKLAATVAYRKNQLGINTGTPATDAVLDIHQTTGLSRIYLKGIANASDVLWTLDIPNGTMAYSVTGGSSYTFDLYNGYYTIPQIDTMIGWVESSLLELL